MSDFGCFYNPRPTPGRCIKDTGSKNVDSQCEISGESCKLKGTVVTKENLILIPTPVTAKINQSLVTTGSVNSKLSGPVAAYSGTDNNNISYYLFSDAHFSLENECKDPCKKIGTKDIQGSENCWDITRLLSDIFKRSEANNQYVDFYIEMPFLPKGTYKPSEEVIRQMVPKLGELYKIYYIFYDCFDKSNCKYKNVRFHYADVRLQYSQKLRSMGDIQYSDFGTKDISFQEYIFKRVQLSLILLGEKMQSDSRTPNQYIETTDKLMKKLYYSGGQTMMGYEKPLNLKLFELYLSSDRYAGDVTKLMLPILEEIPDAKDAAEVTEALITPNILVNRRGKNMHRTRAQLEALENEGRKDIADKINAYVLEQYMKNVDNSTLMALWDKFMKLYNSFVNARARVMGDERVALERLIKEYESFSKFLELNVSSTALLMDAYILARMFRTFAGSSHKVSNKRIVYAGAKHIDIYVDFLSKNFDIEFTRYGTTTDKLMNDHISGNPINRCINVDIGKFQ